MPDSAPFSGLSREAGGLNRSRRAQHWLLSYRNSAAKPPSINSTTYKLANPPYMQTISHCSQEVPLRSPDSKSDAFLPESAHRTSRRNPEHTESSKLSAKHDCKPFLAEINRLRKSLCERRAVGVDSRLQYERGGLACLQHRLVQFRIRRQTGDEPRVPSYRNRYATLPLAIDGI